MTVRQVADRLGDRFRLLTGGSRTAVARHQTLRAVVAWSWDLLSDEERHLAERLAVFAGGATQRSAEDVCAGSDLPADDVLDLLMALADKSLVQIIGGTATRYRMLETIREYGDSAPRALLPVTLPNTLPVGVGAVTATEAAKGSDAAILDAIMVEPVVSRYVLGSGDHGTALLRSADTSDNWATVAVPGHGKLLVEVYDSTGALREQSQSGSANTATVNVHVLAGGFTLVRR